MSDDDRMRTERRFPGWAAEEHMRDLRARIDAALAVVAELREEARDDDLEEAEARWLTYAADRIERALLGSDS